MTDSGLPRSGGFALRDMRDGDAERLAEVDRRADQLFLETGIASIAALATGPRTPFKEFQAMLDDCTTYVACPDNGEPVGLAAVQPLDDDIYLRLLAVDPDFGRRGIGSALLQRALEHGRRHGARRCALSTFRDVTFNEPFYRRHGFNELPLGSASARLCQRFEAEVPDGVDPAQRLLMVRDL